MLVNIIKNGVESEWHEFTKQQHRTLLQDNPEAVIVHIEDFYPGSPDVGQLVRLELVIFTVLAREFVLIENCQEKRAERHDDQQSIDNIDINKNHALFISVEEEYLRRERRQDLNQVLGQLTPAQRRRLTLSIEYGLSYRKIAWFEGVDYSSVKESIQAAKGKIKRLLGYTPSKDGFLSD